MSYVAPALALSRFIDLLLFQIQNVHSSGKQDIPGLRVPSVEGWRPVLSITWADNRRGRGPREQEASPTVRRGEEMRSTGCAAVIFHISNGRRSKFEFELFVVSHSSWQ